MNDKRFNLVKCVDGQWGIWDNELGEDFPIIRSYSDTECKMVLDLLNGFVEKEKYIVESNNNPVSLNDLNYLDEQHKVTTEDIIGLVKTDEPTNSVDLKKELYIKDYERTQSKKEEEDNEMKEDYSATISSELLNMFGGWSVTVRCNNLETFTKLCEYINEFTEE